MKTRICGRVADKLYSRGFGMRAGKCIELSLVEYAYLVEKNILKANFIGVLREASQTVSNFDVQYLVYRDLRERGYVLSVGDGYFRGRKNYSMNFYPISDMDNFVPQELLKREIPFMLSIVDSDGEITYYLVDIIEPEGTYFRLPAEGVDIELYGRRAYCLSPMDNLELNTYGRNEGNWGHLSLLEARYLWEKGLCSKKPQVEEKLYAVYRYLRDRGLIVKSGFKYGTHFRVYENSMEEHSKYLVHVISGTEEIQKISRAVRVAHGVRKELLLAYVNEAIIKFFKVSWVRP